VKGRDATDLILLAALWGASFLFMRIAAPQFGPLPLMGLRCAIGAAVLVPLLAWQGGMGVLRSRPVALGVVGLLNSALSLIGAIVFIVVVPVVAFYLLMDWDRMVAQVDSWLPRDHAPTVRRLASEIDTVLAGFVRGQVSVCVILGTFYSVALMAAEPVSWMFSTWVPM
jgi:predicted PurR-regulated permease PerM